MNCREFTNEFEERNSLTETATLHLNGCPDCQKMSSRQTYVWQMVDALEQVNAPKDFDFRVKARIANARPTDLQPRFLPVLRYVLPASIIVLLVGFIAFNTFNFSSNQSGEQMSATIPSMPTTRENFSVNPPSEIQVVAANTQPFNEEKSSVGSLNASTEQPKLKKEMEVAAVKSPLNRPNQIPKTQIKNDLAGSRTSTFKSATIIIPENVNPNQKIETAPNKDALPILVEQMGAFLGFEIVTENGNRKVKSVRQNSLAARSGIKVGDVIEELNGKKLSDESFRTKTIEAKTLTVRRGAEKVEIVLQK